MLKIEHQRKDLFIKQLWFAIDTPLPASRESYLPMKIIICFFALFCSFVVFPTPGSNSFAGEVKQDGEITIITSGTVARLCPQPGCGPDEHITRVPEGTVLKIERIEDYAIGTFKVKWFEVVYQEKRGWISIFDTDRKP